MWSNTFKSHILIVIHEDNVEYIVEYIAQIKERYIKDDWIKHISSNSSTLMSFRRAMKLMLRSSYNLANLFIKALLTVTPKKIIYSIKMQ